MNCLDIIPDTLLHRFCFQRLLSSKPGIFVFSALYRETQQAVVVKIWKSTLSDSQAHVHNILNEVSLLKKISHDHIVKLLDYGQAKDCTYMVMEYISDFSLRRYILSQPISLFSAMNLIQQIVSSVAALHQIGVIHRDLKPENILLTDDQKIVLVDFGMAVSVSLEQEHQEVFLGTPAYISPEVRQGDACSFASDQYAVGVIAYELLIGNLSRGKIILSLLPEQASKILAKMLSPSPKNRYPSMLALLHDLQSYCDSKRIIDDLKEKDLHLHRYETIREERDWLMPKNFSCPSFLHKQVNIYETGIPSLYYDAFIDTPHCDNCSSQEKRDCLHETTKGLKYNKESLNNKNCKFTCKTATPKAYAQYTFWFWSSPVYDMNPFILSMIKGFVHQCRDLHFSIHHTLQTIHKYIIEMKVPIPQRGISVLCLYMCEEKQHFLCFACGKTCFQLKKRNTCVDVFQTYSQGLGMAGPLQIQESKVAWEIGDEAIILAPHLEDQSSSFSSSAFMELKDRTQKAIFGSRRDLWCNKQVSEDGSLCPPTCISLKRVR